MVAKLMIMDDKYIYINKTSSDIITYALDTLKAIVLFDCQNKVVEKELQSFISGSESAEFRDFEMACILVSRCSRFYNEQNIELLFLLDQTNLILGDPDLKVQFKFLNWIMSNFKTIISGSANNEVEVLKVTESALHFPPIQFSFEEFKVFRTLFSNGLKFVTTVEKANQVLSITGGVALELNRFLKAKNANSFNRLILEYQNDFSNALL
jgi:hypothetical protein